MDLTLPLDYSAIERILPHRYPFLLVDRITEFEPDKRIVGIKNVTLSERYLARSRVNCSALGVPHAAKLEGLAIDATARTVTFQVLGDENCGYIGLEPGRPEN